MASKFQKFVVIGTVVDLLIAIGLIVLVAIKYANYGHSFSGPSSTNGTVGTSTTVRFGQQEPSVVNEKIKAYYIVTIVVLAVRLLAGILVFVGHKLELVECFRSHLDMSIPVTIINFSVYVLIAAEESPHKEFTAAMAFYIVVRLIVLVMEFLHSTPISTTPKVQNISVRYPGNGDTVATSDNDL